MFSKRKNKNVCHEVGESTTKEENAAVLYKKPLICLFDFDAKSVNAIKNEGFNILHSSLGSPVLMPDDNRNNGRLFLLNHDWPSNIHEYDIFIVDMEIGEAVSYNEDKHKRLYQTDEFASYFLVEHPQTVFDGRGFSGKALRNELNNIVGRTYIVIVFASQKKDFTYKIIKSVNHGYTNSGTASYDNYSFIWNPHHSKNIHGEEIDVCVIHSELNSLLMSCKHLMHYQAAFYHPTTWKGNAEEPDANFFPLMRNKNKEIISYVKIDEGCTTFLFPQMREKEKLLIPLLENILPSLHPDVFPESTLFSWKNEQEYWLPNHAELLERKQDLERKFQVQKKQIDAEIEANLSEFAFLHELLSQTDDMLVNAVIKFLHWLDFPTVIEMDNNKSVKEEDIQVVLDDGILIIECKGIGGTSKDSDCSQISKVKHRRCKERNKFDVSALYIVNNQRYLPPKSRKNPPFSEHQIDDAKNDERGLLTTWELFNAYFMEKSGIIDKSYIRTRLLDYGLVSFAPSEQQYLGKAKEVFKDGCVIILTLNGSIINKKDDLIVVHGCSYRKATVLNIQLNGTDVETARVGEVGLLIDKPVKRNSKVYLAVANK